MFAVVRAIVNVVMGVIEIFLLLRLVFKFFLANPSAPFVSWLYAASGQFIAPIARIFPDFQIGNFLFETTTFVALLVYVLIGYLILQIFSIDRGHYDDEV